MANLSNIITPTNVLTASSTNTLTNKTISGSSNTITNVSLTTGITGTLPVANGGTGATSLTANNVLLGNGTSALQVVAPGTNGNVLTSNGTTWTSAAPAGGAWTFISSQTASSSATISFTGIGSTYDVYAIQLVRVVPDATFLFLQLLTSTDNGSTYASSGYSVVTQKLDGTAPGYSGTAQSYINLTPSSSLTAGNVSDTASVGVSGWVYLWKPSQAAESTITYDLIVKQQTTYYRVCGAAAQTASADVDAVRFLFSSGNISTGTFRIYGIKNS